GDVHLEPLGGLGDRQGARPGERQEPEQLVPGEREIPRAKGLLDAGQEDLVGAHHRGHHGHPLRGIGPAFPLPVGAGLIDAVGDRVGPRGHGSLLTGTAMGGSSLSVLTRRSSATCPSPTRRPPRPTPRTRPIGRRASTSAPPLSCPPRAPPRRTRGAARSWRWWRPPTPMTRPGWSGPARDAEGADGSS